VKILKLQNALDKMPQEQKSKRCRKLGWVFYIYTKKKQQLRLVGHNLFLKV
jgi:hypothetical protein